MRPQYKKIFSITLAILVGLGIIFSAWKGLMLMGTKVSTGTKPDDSWKDSLLVVPQASTTKTLSSHGSINSDVDVATTSTDIFARKLLVNYALKQKNMSTTTWSDADAEILAQSLINDAEARQATQYTKKDLRVSNDNSATAVNHYGSKISTLFKTRSAKQNDGEATIFLNVLSTGDYNKLDELTPFIDEYATMKRSLIELKVPSDIAPLHLRLVQNFANTESALIAMQKLFSDPIQGLTGFTQYKNEIDTLIVIGNDYLNYKPASL